MKVSYELDLPRFEFWSGAKNHGFKHSELEELENIFDDLFPEGLSETDINDLFWFEEEYLCELLGIDFDEDYSER